MNERLKEIEAKYYSAVDMVLSEGETMPYYDIDIADLNHLIEQAKTVEELKNSELEWINYQLDMNEMMKGIVKENKELHEEIDFNHKRIEKTEEQNERLKEENEDFKMRYESTGSIFNRQSLMARIELLESQNKRYREEIESHAPEGRNYTNAQYVELLNESERYMKVLGGIQDWSVCEDSQNWARKALEDK